MSYSFFTDKRNQTPQTEPIPGREAEMIQGKSGAVAFDAGIWKQLRRCMITGTAGGSYYAGKQELTKEFTEVLQRAVAEDPRKVADEILYASDGRSVNNSAPILGLVYLSLGKDKQAKDAFKEIFPRVIRTGSHFYEWLKYTKAMRGMGKVVREAGREWLGRDDVQALTYQLLKYQQRQGFSHRDALRLFHVKPKTEEHAWLYKWAVKGWNEEEFNRDGWSPALQQIWYYEWLKRNPKGGATAVQNGRLTHEMVAPVCEMNKGVWQALFDTMPITALLRNLGSLTEIGVLRADEPKNLDRVEAVLNNREYLRNGRIHPIDVLKAYKTYVSGGSLGKSKKTWTVVGRIADILDKAVELSFETQEPTGKVFLHAVDISASMSWKAVESVGLTYAEIAACMALVTAKSEKNYSIRGFSTQFVDLGITAKDSFGSALQKMKGKAHGGTDANAVYDWAIKERFKADTICMWTDSESWAGYRHPSQGLKAYRSRVADSNANAIYVTLAPNRLSLVDPTDPRSWDLGGFDPSTPKVIQMIASGEL